MELSYKYMNKGDNDTINHHQSANRHGSFVFVD
jgi:hypothetical protein